MKPIDKGTTWVWEMKFYSDAAKTVPLDVSAHLFAWVVKSSSGATVITKADAAFTQVASNHRKLTLSNTDTAGLTAGIHAWELNVTLPDATVELWQQDYITIEE
jgi:hypothetical protein